MSSSDDIEKFIQEQEGSALISLDTPLISNLDMCENIALIKAFHERMPIEDANALAIEMMSSVGLENIVYKRVNSCSKEEMFLVMFIRAIMSKDERVIVKSPNKLLDNLLNIKELLTTMRELNSSKKVIIVDLVNNKNYYEGTLCNTEI